MTGVYHFIFYEARKIDRSLVLKRDGEPVDLSGMHARMQLRDRPRGRLMTEFSDTDGSITLNVEGAIHLRKTATEAGAWTGWNSGVYDLILINSEGEALEPLLKGTYQLVPAVTV